MARKSDPEKAVDDLAKERAENEKKTKVAINDNGGAPYVRDRDLAQGMKAVPATSTGSDWRNDNFAWDKKDAVGPATRSNDNRRKR